MHSPRVFISYSHDTPEHASRVLRFANALRRDGIDCIIDRYETSPADGWPTWMVNQVQEADFVLIVCTEVYEYKFSGKSKTGRGATWEGAVITQHIYNSFAENNSFIPIVFSKEDLDNIPIILNAATYYVIPTIEQCNLARENIYATLYRRLTGQPQIVKPEVGQIVVLQPETARPVESKFKNDIVRRVETRIVQDGLKRGVVVMLVLLLACVVLSMVIMVTGGFLSPEEIETQQLMSANLINVFSGSIFLGSIYVIMKGLVSLFGHSI